MMEDFEIEKFTVEDIGTVFLKSDVNAHIYAAHREEVYNWLKTHNHGDIVKEYVHPGTLKAFVKEQLEKGAKLPPQDLMKSEPIRVAQLRRK